MASRVIPVETFDLVIFGGTGDLAQRKILPGLYRRFCAGQMPRDARIIGASRSQFDDAGYQEFVREAVLKYVNKNKIDTDNLDAFINQLRYIAIDARGENGWKDLAKLVRRDASPPIIFPLGLVCLVILPNACINIKSRTKTRVSLWKNRLAVILKPRRP